MNKKDLAKSLIKRGSKTAKGGFTNEKDVISRFNNWEQDSVAKEWLNAMGYNISDIEYVKAIKIEGRYKADVQVRVRIIIKLKHQEDLQNLQVKLVSNKKSGGNQVDRRWVEKCETHWHMPADIAKILRLFSGELKSTKVNLKDPRRMFFYEMSEEDREKIINFFKKNKILIISDLLKGRGEFSADWVLVIMKDKGESGWVLKSINEAMNVFGQGDVVITPQGSLRIGRIGMQRKGGDGGREGASMLQFKINPLELFDK